MVSGRAKVAMIGEGFLSFHRVRNLKGNILYWSRLFVLFRYLMLGNVMQSLGSKVNKPVNPPCTRNEVKKPGGSHVPTRVPLTRSPLAPSARPTAGPPTQANRNKKAQHTPAPTTPVLSSPSPPASQLPSKLGSLASGASRPRLVQTRPRAPVESPPRWVRSTGRTLPHRSRGPALLATSREF